MPFDSKRQQRFMYANREKMEKQGVDVDEWSRKTDYSKIPDKKEASEASETQEGPKRPRTPVFRIKGGQLERDETNIEPFGQSGGPLAGPGNRRKPTTTTVPAGTMPTAHSGRQPGQQPRKRQTPVYDANQGMMRVAGARPDARLARQGKRVWDEFRGGRDAKTPAPWMRGATPQQSGATPQQQAGENPHVIGGRFDFTNVKTNAVNPNIQLTPVEPVERGDQLNPQMIANPYQGDPERGAEYENGFQFATALGVQDLQGVLPEQAKEQWETQSEEWKQGLVAGFQSLGRKDLADALGADLQQTTEQEMDQAPGEDASPEEVMQDTQNMRPEETDQVPQKVAAATMGPPEKTWPSTFLRTSGFTFRPPRELTPGEDEQWHAAASLIGDALGEERENLVRSTPRTLLKLGLTLPVGIGVGLLNPQAGGVMARATNRLTGLAYDSLFNRKSQLNPKLLEKLPVYTAETDSHRFIPRAVEGDIHNVLLDMEPMSKTDQVPQKVAAATMRFSSTDEGKESLESFRKNNPEAFERQLEMGIEVEKEHGGDKGDWKKTALDHIAESKTYYTDLKKVEEGKVAATPMNWKSTLIPAGLGAAGLVIAPEMIAYPETFGMGEASLPEISMGNPMHRALIGGAGIAGIQAGGQALQRHLDARKDRKFREQLAQSATPFKAAEVKHANYPTGQYAMVPTVERNVRSGRAPRILPKTKAERTMQGAGIGTLLGGAGMALGPILMGMDPVGLGGIAGGALAGGALGGIAGARSHDQAYEQELIQNLARAGQYYSRPPVQTKYRMTPVDVTPGQLAHTAPVGG